MVGPHAPAHEADGDAREHHERVAEDRLAGEHRDDLGHDAEGGQDQDVDLRVPEDPEQVLPQQRVGALLHDEEVGVEEPVEGEQEQRHRDHRHGEHEQHLDDEAHPGEHRHLHERHAGRPHVQAR